jgi:hypothetical protein
MQAAKSMSTSSQANTKEVGCDVAATASAVKAEIEMKL